MKKFLNKLSNSGNLREESTYDKEHMDTHFRKPTTLAQDTKDTSEEIKLRKSYSLSKATSPRFRESMDSDEFSKKKSSTGMKKEGKEGKDNEKLHESDDKALRKSFSLRGVFNKSSDQVKVETVRSPSIKNVFSSYDKVNRDPAEMDNSDSDEDQDAFVPHKFDDDEHLASAPIRVPSAPGRMTSSPPPLSPTRASPSSPPMHLSTSSVRSPSSNNTLHFTPTSPNSLSSSSPIVVPSSPPSVAIPAFTQSPPSNAQVPKIVAVDEFDSHFNFNNDKNNNDIFRGRTDSITDDYGSEFGRIHRADSQVDGASEGDEIMDDDEEESIHVKKGGRFGFGLNKSRKLKA